jgi:GNAT superfamily N-acetyltransferase
MFESVRSSDFEAIARLAGQLGYPSQAEEVAERWADLQAREDQCLLVARDPDGVEVVGCVHAFEQRSLMHDPRACVAGLVVDERCRGQGIGSALLARVEEWARDRGLGRVRFTSNIIRTEAHRLYRRLGYGSSKTSHVFEKSLGPSGV